MTETLFVWQVLQDGRWGMISASAPIVGGHVPLMHRDEAVARHAFESIARGHGEKTGLLVRLARFDFAEEIERVG